MRFANLVFGLLIVLPLYAQATDKLSPEAIYAQSKGSVVKIVTFDANNAPLAQGSGFVVAKNRVITNYHVLSGSAFASVVFDDGSTVAVKSVVYSMPPEDVATVEAETGNRPPLSWGDELQLKVGEAVYAIGAPSGLSTSLSNGLISAFRLDKRDVLFIQITAIIAPGSSGGPLFNSQGQVVGITTSRLKDSDFGFAVGIGDIQLLLTRPLSSAVALSDLSPLERDSPDYELKSATPSSAVPSIAYSQYLLGWQYETGIDAKQDYAKAASWYRKSADLGSPQGQFGLGVLYENGHGVTQDFTQAAVWYRKAAEQGDPDAQYALGEKYYRGQGVPRDYAEAYFWAYLAMSGSQINTAPEDAAVLRDDAASHLSSTVLTQTRARARKWLEEHPPFFPKTK
ncbi:MAG: bifunctional trypsin-like peptidase domain-containing/SEL1-like repeat protein [Terracidiphilus sp.]|jgi:hypothetical protein